MAHLKKKVKNFLGQLYTGRNNTRSMESIRIYFACKARQAFNVAAHKVAQAEFTLTIKLVV